MSIKPEEVVQFLKESAPSRLYEADDKKDDDEIKDGDEVEAKDDKDDDEDKDGEAVEVNESLVRVKSKKGTFNIFERSQLKKVKKGMRKL